MARPLCPVAWCPLRGCLNTGFRAVGGFGTSLPMGCWAMDESVGMLSVAAVLVFGIWLVDYSGDAARASVSVRSASVDAAQYAASALATPPASVAAAALDAHAADIAERFVGAAAISDCDTADARYGVTAAVHRLPGDITPAAVSVEVTCPLAVSPLFADTVRFQTAVPIPATSGSGP